MRKLITIFAIPELRRKILITLLFLIVYRVGYSIPLPMMDQAKLAKRMAEQSQGALGQVFGLVVRGKLNKQIAHELGTTERTIKAHRHQVMEKMNVQSLAELVRFAERLGVLGSGTSSSTARPD